MVNHILIVCFLPVSSSQTKSMEYDTPRISRHHSSDQSQAQPRVCYQWQLGRCYRLPCPFLHPDIPFKRKTHVDDPRSFQYSAPAPFQSGRGRGRGMDSAPKGSAEKLCKFWALGKCNYGDRCRFLHSWCIGDSFTFVTALEGHEKVVLSLILLERLWFRVSAGLCYLGSDKLYSASKDESVRIWDCQSGQAWNIETNNEISLGGLIGQVYSLEANDELLFAGSQDGSILVWKFNNVGNSFESAATLLVHNLTVVSLIVGGTQRLYSGSMDNTIRVWAATESGNLEVTYTHNAEHCYVPLFLEFRSLLPTYIKHRQFSTCDTCPGAAIITGSKGVLGLCGMHDAQAKPVLMRACDDNAVRVYDLPSFKERGKVLSKEEIRSIQLGPDGLFFTGDRGGALRVWKWRTT
ncbi:hypothetical protein ACLOJK_005225 [Asimina triloba]